MEKKEKYFYWIVIGILIILLLSQCKTPEEKTGGGSSGGGSSGGGSCPSCPVCETPTTHCSSINGVCTDRQGSHTNSCSNGNAVNYICDTALDVCTPSTTNCGGDLRQGYCYMDTAYNRAICGG